MSSFINRRVASIGLFGVAGVLFTSAACLGFGAVSVGGVGISVGTRGVAAATADASTDDGAGETATPTQSKQVPTAPRHADRPASKRALTAARSDMVARASADPPLNPNRPAKPAKAAPAPARAADQPVAMPLVAGNVGAAPVVVDLPNPLSTTSVMVNPDPLPPTPIAQFEREWTISGHFFDFKSPPLPTGLAALIVMLLSAASGFGFVRLMSEKCPQCAALLARHSVGCRNCGALLRPSDHSGWRLSA